LAVRYFQKHQLRVPNHPDRIHAIDILKKAENCGSSGEICVCNNIGLPQFFKCPAGFFPKFTPATSTPALPSPPPTENRADPNPAHPVRPFFKLKTRMLSCWIGFHIMPERPASR